MKVISLVIILILVILFGCKNDEIVPPTITGQEGQLVLKIDRENAPQNITTVTASLTRSGYTTITSSLNLLSDSTADLNLESIPVGQWHLKVDAADNAGVVQYTGEVDVNIIENQTIQVTLILNPLRKGVGSIYFHVK